MNCNKDRKKDSKLDKIQPKNWNKDRERYKKQDKILLNRIRTKIKKMEAVL